MGYSPTLGRWLEEDPDEYVDGPSLYQYVQSSPTNLIDPLGLWGGGRRAQGGRV